MTFIAALVSNIIEVAVMSFSKAAHCANRTGRHPCYGVIINALYDAGISMNDVNPDYVIVGETRGYNFEKIEKAVFLVAKGARLIGTNLDLTGPTEQGIVPATRALMAPIELATGKQAYYI